MAMHAPGFDNAGRLAPAVPLCGCTVEGDAIASARLQVTCQGCLERMQAIEQAMKSVMRVELWRQDECIGAITGNMDYVLGGLEMFERASGFTPTIAYRRMPDGTLVRFRELGRPGDDCTVH